MLVIVQVGLGQFKKVNKDLNPAEDWCFHTITQVDERAFLRKNAHAPQSGHDFVLSKSFRKWGKISGGLTSPQHKCGGFGIRFGVAASPRSECRIRSRTSDLYLLVSLGF
jgi:hypothetical protein